jgi:hypothetical protein
LGAEYMSRSSLGLARRMYVWPTESVKARANEWRLVLSFGSSAGKSGSNTAGGGGR